MATGYAILMDIHGGKIDAKLQTIPIPEPLRGRMRTIVQLGRILHGQDGLLVCRSLSTHLGMPF
jgi:hypothetical protein